MNSRREGFTIVEVVVAIVLLSVILTSLAAMTMHAAAQAIYTSDTAARDAAALELVNRLNVMPLAELQGYGGCTDTGTPGKQFERCVTVTADDKALVVAITTTPKQRAVKPSTITFRRAISGGSTALCTGC